MVRFMRWLIANVDAVVALLIAVTVGILSVLDVLGTEKINAAILLVLALLATTLLQDRRSASKAQADTSAVRQLSRVEINQELAEARRHTEQWTYKGGTRELTCAQ
jgi:hypothetical protein